MIDPKKIVLFDQAAAELAETWPRLLGEFNRKLLDEGFGMEDAASMTEVMFDHLLAATLGRKE